MFIAHRSIFYGGKYEEQNKIDNKNPCSIYFHVYLNLKRKCIQ